MASIALNDNIDDILVPDCHTVDFQKNFNSFLVLLHRLDIIFDVIILTECHLGTCSVINSIPGYTHFSSDKIVNQAGGVVIYAKDQWNTSVSEPDIEDADCLEIKLDNSLTVLGVYRSPSTSDIENFTTSLSNYVNSNPSTKLVIAGDININILEENNQSSEYLCLMAELGLRPTIAVPTRGPSCLDHIMVNIKSDAIGLVCKTDATDHFLVMAGIKDSCRPIHRPKLSSKINFDALIEDVRNFDWSVVTKLEDASMAAKTFRTNLESMVKNNTKTVTIKRKEQVLKEWITPGLVRCMKHRDWLHLQHRKEPNNRVIEISYKRYRNFFGELLKKLKSQHENRQFLENKDDPRKLWKVIAGVCELGSKKGKASQLLKIKSSPQDSLTACNDFFANVGKKLATSILSSLGKTQEDLARSSTVGIFPECWKHAAVVPIHKGGSKDDPSHYRPISLLPVFSKILKKIVNSRLVDYLEKFNILNPQQFGFRRKKSTEDAVKHLLIRVANALDSGRACVGVFLDLAKAFDTVSPVILLRKLEAYGIRGIANDWFASYLTDRKQTIVIDNYQSEQRTVEYGVPQGSILGPTLFNIYINDLPNLFSSNEDIDTVCYADDTAILFVADNWREAYRHLIRRTL
ncbi:reverse transcriptase (RNA-dependent DNA polymerase) domain-containing protein [Phthorimaea operculella]|nr:reverse transcriptase (RNA-dependent DNA polymerase) domain-containing protein [Phthorimaea operculella]